MMVKHDLVDIFHYSFTYLLAVVLKCNKEKFLNGLPFNSQKWLTCNFSLQQPYIIQQTSDENTQTYQLEVAILI